jgi:frataxin-like iron-binding protein CyaY
LNSFNASPSALWLSSFFTGFHFDSCHRASFAVFDE